ncbi:helix-turn-helix transcriptional regulator [Streptomyces sp. N2-109]|uniref:Helix-turn-helix transcriptional regulator n=1 Tax=Streptomyces gossypii TaxID=2883101 RepID=A0ABT2JSB0_9ACTN|nr:helix-turn-helix transcriptional regulator [Streptomyces gossypii]MCT2590374.1 helix-turn-helix transcriptional regulator [Streptomyces gossypii]
MPATRSRRQQELRDFLMTRRARVSPADVGLPDGGGRRRTPGLRREEVAVLAGVGASWYQWLEQGRDITVSPQVLDAVARVLRLSDAERRHLYILAGLNPPLARSEFEPGHLCGGFRRLIDAWMPFPAHILDAYWNAIALNDAARLVFGLHVGDNCLTSFFTDPVYRGRLTSWERTAPAVVAQFRQSQAERPEDEGFRLLFDQLTAESEEFTELWARGDVQPGGQLRKEVEHRVVGALFFESSHLHVPARPDLTIVLHNPVPDTGTVGKLEHLIASEGCRPHLRPMAG